MIIQSILLVNKDAPNDNTMRPFPLASHQYKSHTHAKMEQENDDCEEVQLSI